MAGINNTATNLTANRLNRKHDVILRRAQALRRTSRFVCGAHGAGRNAHDAYSTVNPVHSTRAFGPRKVPPGGFAAAQDDKRYFSVYLTC